MLTLLISSLVSDYAYAYHRHDSFLLDNRNPSKSQIIAATGLLVSQSLCILLIVQYRRTEQDVNNYFQR